MNRIPQAPPKRLAAAPQARRPSRTAVRAAALIGVSLLSGFAFRTPPMTEPALATDATQPTAQVEPAAPEQTPAAIEIAATIEAPVPEAPPATETPAPEEPPTEDPEDLTSEIEAITYLESADLDPETQNAIWEVCKENPRLFCMVMAMAYQESRFDTQAVGDHGNSLGLLQVQPRWHQERMNRLGVTDLMDPVQNAMVAVDYIDWIADLLNPEHPEDAYATEMLLMAYNQGWAGAKESWSLGTYSTYYSRVVMSSYAAFMEEMEVEP